MGGTEEQDIKKKKKGIACRQRGLWTVGSRQGQGASGQMAQWLELQSWGVGSRLGKKGRRIILKRQAARHKEDPYYERGEADSLRWAAGISVLRKSLVSG